MKRIRGFTLIELAIVLVIITILIGGLAMPLSAQIQARRIAETQKILEEAREAIIGFALSSATSLCTCVYTSDVLDPATTTCPSSLCSARFESMTGDATFNVSPRHHLPCPDRDGDGREDRYEAGLKEDECVTDSGNFPWVTLGTASQDAWGNRLRYAVTGTFADKSIGLTGTGGGDFKVCSTSGCATVDVADEVVAVLISYGPNGWGARSIHNKMLKAPTSDDEKENTNASINFVSRSPYKPADGSAAEQAKEFDDLVKWISADQLRGRICPAGGCP